MRKSGPEYAMDLVTSADAEAVPSPDAGVLEGMRSPGRQDECASCPASDISAGPSEPLSSCVCADQKGVDGTDDAAETVG
jgi:hypothetical protein